jgi:hypothetical protein
VGERVSVDRVSGAAPGLYLLGEALCVWGSENTDLGRVSEGIGQVVQESGDGLGDADGCQDTGAK